MLASVPRNPLAGLIGLGALLCLAGASADNKQSLIDIEDYRSGGFGGPVIKYGSLSDEGALMIGGGGAGTFTSGDHSLFIGGAGYGLVNELDWGTDQQLEMGYGGLMLGYTHQPDRLVHVETSLLVGGGGVTILDDQGNEDDNASFMVSELTVSGEVNLTDFLEVGLGGAYRLTSDPDISGLSAGDLSGPSVFLSFQFGKI